MVRSRGHCRKGIGLVALVLELPNRFVSVGDVQLSTDRGQLRVRVIEGAPFDSVASSKLVPERALLLSSMMSTLAGELLASRGGPRRPLPCFGCGALTPNSVCIYCHDRKALR